MVFFLDALAQPLLDHALIIQAARPGKPLDAGEHARVKSKSDGNRFTGIGLEQRSVHQAHVEAVFRPEAHFFPLAFKFGDFRPSLDDVHERKLTPVRDSCGRKN